MVVRVAVVVVVVAVAVLVILVVVVFGTAVEVVNLLPTERAQNIAMSNVNNTKQLNLTWMH